MEEFVEIELDDQGQVMPQKIDKVALIDADTIAYIACLNTEVAAEVLPQEMYSEMEWDAIINNKQYDEELQVIYETDVNQALLKANDKLQRILDKTGCTSYELHFTGGRDNFRYKIFPEYKANRTGRSPAGLFEVKKAMCEQLGGTIHEGWEADDMVVYLRNLHPEKYMLVAIDKDVLNSVEGTHFNYDESSMYNIDMKFVEVSKHTSLTWRYLQTLMGDKTDGIIGLHGIGPKKAEKIIDGNFTHSDIWKAVVEAYKMKGRTADEALLNLNLVDMKLLKEVDGELKIVLRTHEEMK